MYTPGCVIILGGQPGESIQGGCQRDFWEFVQGSQSGEFVQEGGTSEFRGVDLMFPVQVFPRGSYHATWSIHDYFDINIQHVRLLRIAVH